MLRIIQNYKIRNYFGITQFADTCFIPENKEDIVNIIKNNSNLIVLGIGSNVVLQSRIKNLLVTDKLNKIYIEEDYIYCESGVLDRDISSFYLENEFEGAEFLCTIPGTLGGNIMSNAGCYGRSISDIIISIQYIDRSGNILETYTFDKYYRKSLIDKEYIVISAKMKFKRSNKELILSRMKEYINKRDTTQPIRSRTGGSTFVNPEGYKAWELIDRCGLRGFTIGSAKLSEKHSNFIEVIENIDSSANDIVNLIKFAQNKVYEKYGLIMEIELIVI